MLGRRRHCGPQGGVQCWPGEPRAAPVRHRLDDRPGSPAPTLDLVGVLGLPHVRREEQGMRRVSGSAGSSGSDRRQGTSTPIEDYALLSNLRTAALVSRDGSVDWLCLPRFDSAACFAALLGRPEHGRWLIAPSGEAKSVQRRYLPETLVLETIFETEGGAVRLVDFMPPGRDETVLARIVEGLEGEVEISTELVLRFEYGSAVPWLRRHDHVWLAVVGPDAVRIESSIELEGKDFTSVGSTTVSAGERLPFALTWFASHEQPPDPVDADGALEETEGFWREWSGRCGYRGEWDEPVRTSLRVLKALIYDPTGGIVAAPTTSLPEAIGGPRNWDYRFCWLRDATLTLVALIDSGYLDEARAWREWLFRAAAGRPGGPPDHVRGRRRASTRGVRGRLAAGLRGLDAGPGGQRSLRADAARRLRRDHRSLHDREGARTRGIRPRLAAVAEPARVPGGRVAQAGRGHLGGARAEPALHAFEGDGLGGVRPRAPNDRELGARRPGRPLALDSRRDPRRRLCQRLRPRRCGRSCSRTARSGWMRACC